LLTSEYPQLGNGTTGTRTGSRAPTNILKKESPASQDTQNSMAYQPSKISNEGRLKKAICLYTTPLQYQRDFFKLKKPIDVFAHWAICVQGRCYELTRNDDPYKTKKDPKYLIKDTDEQDWLRKKHDKGRDCKPKHAGYTQFSSEKIHEVGEYSSSHIAASFTYHLWLTDMGKQPMQCGIRRCDTNTHTTGKTAKSSFAYSSI
jgi:hypothetical protein